MDNILIVKVTTTASLTKIHFPKISGQAPLILKNIEKVQHHEKSAILDCHPWDSK